MHLHEVYHSSSFRGDECEGYLKILFDELSYLDEDRSIPGNLEYKNLLNLLDEVEECD